jgi:hypothetical protein
MDDDTKPIHHETRRSTATTTARIKSTPAPFGTPPHRYYKLQDKRGNPQTRILIGTSAWSVDYGHANG